MNWFEQIAFQAKLRPEEPAVIFPGGMATYARLVECVEHASQHLLRAGVTKGEIIALEIRHPLLHLVAILALHRCGVASLTLQTGHLAEQSQLKIDRLLSDRFQPSEQGWKQVMVTNEWLLPPKPGTPLLPLA
jgi:acyl-coenzyme A synthetase/AMP-(fatty) acid ligase